MKKQKHEVFPHFSVEVVKQRYLECECLRERTHWHIIWLLADTRDSRTPRQVAEIVGCTPDWVRKLLKRYNLKAKRLCEINAKTMEASVFWMKHSKPHSHLPFLRLLVMAVFGPVRRWLRGYPRSSSVVSVMCQVGNISNVSVILYKHLVHNIRQPQTRGTAII